MSAPFSPNIMIAMNIVTLPPGTISTRSGETSTPRRRCRSSATASRKGGDAGRVGIAVLAVAQRLDGRLDDMRRRFEIGLADAEIDDVAPLALQFGRSRQDGEGVLLADALKGGIDGESRRALPKKGGLLAKPTLGGKRSTSGGSARRGWIRRADGPAEAQLIAGSRKQEQNLLGCQVHVLPKSERRPRNMINETIAEERLAKLESAKSWSSRVVSRLETLIRSAPDEGVFRINPIRFAEERGVAENEAVDLFLHAALVGLVEMDWLLYCPLCSDVVANFRSLRAVHNHFHCHVCHSDYEATLDDYIAVTFTVAPEVRRIRYHDPESLPLDDYLFTYRATLDGLTREGEPLMELMRSGMRGLARLSPKEVSRFPFEAEPGTLLGTIVDSDASFAFPVSGERRAETLKISIVIRGGACEPSGGSMTPGPLVIEVRNETIAARSSALCRSHPAERITACSPSGRSCRASGCS